VEVWDRILSCYEVWMKETMVKQEVLFYKDSSGDRVDIDLMEHVKNGELCMHSVSAAHFIKVLNFFDSAMCSALHPGEIEALAVMHETKDLLFCTGDAKAIEALVLLGLKGQGISLEQLLSNAGLTKKTDRIFQRKGFVKMSEEHPQIVFRASVFDSIMGCSLFAVVD
jgi:hypothetical protein